MRSRVALLLMRNNLGLHLRCDEAYLEKETIPRPNTAALFSKPFVMKE